MRTTTQDMPCQEVPIITALNRAEHEMQTLAKRLSEILIRLESVSRPDCPNPPDCRKDPKPCPVVSTVTSRINSIASMAEKMVEEINHRLELMEL